MTSRHDWGPPTAESEDVLSSLLSCLEFSEAQLKKFKNEQEHQSSVSISNLFHSNSMDFAPDELDDVFSGAQLDKLKLVLMTMTFLWLVRKELQSIFFKNSPTSETT